MPSEDWTTDRQRDPRRVEEYANAAWAIPEAQIWGEKLRMIFKLSRDICPRNSASMAISFMACAN
jgi:hypothetical protein